MKYKLPIIIFILVLCILGTIFLAFLVHEGIHIAQAKTPYSICYDINQKSLMHITVNVSNYNNTEEYLGFKEYTEKWAGIGTFAMVLVCGLGIGVILMCFLYETYHPLLKNN